MTQPLLLKTADGKKTALWKIPGGTGPAVLLTHGTFSNHRSCRGLAEYLATRGFSPWILDWRGHGSSELPDGYDFTLDDVAQFDLPAALMAVRQIIGQKKVFLIGHSGGGLAASIWISRNPHEAAKYIHGMVLMASQATHAARGMKNRTLLQIINTLLKTRKTAPGHYIRIGPEPESAKLMQQWCQWNISQKFHGQDGFNYINELRQTNLPILALAGIGDKFIAPVDGCKFLAFAFGGEDITFYRCGKLEGFIEDYSHSRIIMSRPASREIWPLIATWLEKRAS